MSFAKKLLLSFFLIQSISILNVISANMVVSSNVEESMDTGEGESEAESTAAETQGDTAVTSTQNNDKSNLKTYDSARIIAINKITAQSKEMVLKLKESKYFGNIEIKVHKCHKDLNPYAPDSKILLTVIEEKVDEEPTLLFQGWMMSSNISISTFEHPVYEIFAKDCF